MAVTRKPAYDDNSMGIRRPPVASQPITPNTPMAYREGPPTPPSNITRIPHAPPEDVSEINTTLLPKPAPDIRPIPEFTRNGKTTYLIDKYAHPYGGIVEYSAVLGRDGGGIIWWTDTDWNHGGLSISMTFEQIAALYGAACDARKTGCYINGTPDGKEGA